ncbi:DUF523 domain-containing protein [Geobacillus sp. Y412MC52]|uniref:DUF523 domain-containing protein n=1 Tax=Geobacillus sp. (strain Y412MC52) TaxID=550542 RepID=UPI001E6114B7|nr:DUF523 domain-containing protein [Geobacillus sp. Y412MC52]
MYYAIPTVVVSECLGFSACRYNGDIIRNSFVSRLGEFARLVPVCPEVAIGLGVPRETVRLVKRGEERRLVQSSTNRDWTREMNEFATSFVFDRGGAGRAPWILFVQRGAVWIRFDFGCRFGRTERVEEKAGCERKGKDKRDHESHHVFLLFAT